MAEEKEAAGKKQETDKGKDQKEKSEASAAIAGSPKMMFWGIIGGLVVLELIIMYFVISLTRPKSAEELAAKVASDSMKVSMEHSTSMGSTTKPVELVTNVAGTEGERFIKVAFILEFEDPDSKAKKGGGEEGKEKKKSKTEEEIMRRMPKFKNVLIDLLSSKTLTELNEPNTREQIRKDFMRDINSSLPSEIGKVTDVLFDQFVIQ